MNDAIDSLPAASIRVLAVGSSPALRSAANSLAGEDVAVDGPQSSLDAGAVDESVDCLLVDGLDALDALDGDADRPVVYVTAGAREGADDVDAALSAGAAEVVTPADRERPQLLRRRVARTVRATRAEAERERCEARYRTLAEHSPALTIVADEEFHVTYVGPSVERLAGYDSADVLDASVEEAVHPDDRDSFLDALETVAEGDLGATATREYRCRHADDSWHVHEAIFTNRFDDPVVEGIVVSILDVTARRRAERELTDSFERVTDAFVALDADWRFTYVNDRAEAILDHDGSDLLGRTFLDVFPDVEGTPFQEAAVEAMETQEVRTVDGYYEPVDAWIEARIFPSLTGVSVYFLDVTGRVERERELVDRSERLQAVVENVPVLLFVLDPDGEFVLTEGQALAETGLELDDLVGRSAFDVFEDYPDVREDVSRALDGEHVSSNREVDGRAFETWYRPVTRDGDLERVIGTATDVTDRVRYEETLGAIHEATQNLLAVESKQAACEYVVDVAADVLDLASAVYRFDERENELYPAAYAAELTERIGPPPRLGPNDAIAWEAFVDGIPRVYDDVRTVPDVHDESTNARSGLYVPLGEHGVLVALSTDPGRYDEETVELAQLFAATAEATLDRIGRTRRLHDREQELRRQNDRLERLNRAGRLREDVEQLLLRADSREEIERGVCERVTDVDDWSFAWIGEPDPGGNHVVPRASAGVDRGYLDAVTVTTVDDSATEPTGRAARLRRPVAVDNVGDAIREGDWRAEALSRRVQSVYAVPLVYDDFLYGVLSIYASRTDAFDEHYRSVFAELGETIAYAIDAVKRRGATLDEAVTEIELAVDGGALATLSRTLDAGVSLEGAIPQTDGSTVVFAAIDRAVDVDDLDGVDGADPVAVIRRTEDRTIVQLRLSEPFLGRIADANGAALREFVVDDGDARATVDVPQSIDVREFLSAVARHGIDAALRARRERDGESGGGLGGSYRDAALADLTDRQSEVVQAAYHGGFFEWPRQATGEEVADSLDISPPAFHSHVRAAERKLFADLFDAGEEVN